ncbi:MAG: hypothetical protein WD382_01490, partial [Halofilum sp. (in: g-proteobacteria)]
MRTPSLGALTWLAAVLLLAILLTTLHFVMAEPWRLASFSKLLAFEAAEPFQHRVLLPAIAATLRGFLPIGEELVFALLEVVAWAALIGVAYKGLEWLEIGSSTLVRRILALTFTVPMALHLIVPNLQFKPAYVFQDDLFELGSWHAEALFYYPYDLPAAAFTLALVLLMLRLAREPSARWLLAYLALFAIATVNRETTLFLIPAFAVVCFRVLSPELLTRALLAQVVLFGVIQGALQWTFSDHLNPSAVVPGTAYEYHLIRNLWELANPLYLLTFLARFAGGAYIPLLVLRARLDPQLGRALVCFSLPLLAFALTMGRIQELRIVIEMVPLLWLGALQVVAARPTEA